MTEKEKTFVYQVGWTAGAAVISLISEAIVLVGKAIIKHYEEE